MKRILGMVVALTAVLAFGNVSYATLMTYNVGPSVPPVGNGGSVNSISSFAPSPPGYFITPFDTGSNVVLDYEGSNVTLVSGTLNINATTILGAIGSITTNVVVTFTGGDATGTISGQQILWTTPAAISASGTFSCAGGICTLTGLTPGTPYPIALFSSIAGTNPVTPINLGKWWLNSGLTVIQTTTRMVDATAQLDGSVAQWYTFGVPEPSTIALVLLGFGGLALRSRKA